jgi:hypothetical protein
MENFYSSYTKVIQNDTYYFVKKFLRFPEYKDVSDILEGYGMHREFDKACKIAGIYDPEIRNQLLQQIENAVPQAKVIDLKQPNVISKTKAL